MQPFVICPKCQHLDARRTLCQCGYGDAPPPLERAKEKRPFLGESWPRRAAGYSAKFPLGALLAVYLTDSFLRRDVFAGNTLGLFGMLALQAVLLLGGVGFGVAALWGLARYGGEWYSRPRPFWAYIEPRDYSLVGMGVTPRDEG